VVQGHLAYYGVPGNLYQAEAFVRQVGWYWARALRRRSQRDRMTWARFGRLVAAWLPRGRNMHPWPEERFFATHPR
jgi:RNA-directed DNA polymerase